MVKTFLVVGASLFLGLFMAASAKAQSFDCRFAKLPAEYAICDFADLGELDVDMATAYGMRMRQLKYYENNYRKARAFRRWQRAWLRQRNRCGYNPHCIRRAYKRWFRVFYARW